jgi:hypothetical protein
MQQGLQQGIQHLVLRQLTYRFGDVPGRLSDKLRGLSTEALDDLGLEILNFKSYADVERWLTSH